MSALNEDGLRPQLDFLSRELLPKLLVTYGVGIYRPFRLWCMGCPHEALPLEFARILEKFRNGFPAFSYRVAVTDSCPERIDRARELFRQNCSETFQKDWVTFQQSAPIRYRFNLREPQDVIACFMNLEALEGPCRLEVFQDFCRVLFPGRVLLGERLGLSADGELPFEKVREAVYRRVS